VRPALRDLCENSAVYLQQILSCRQNGIEVISEKVDCRAFIISSLVHGLVQVAMRTTRDATDATNGTDARN